MKGYKVFNHDWTCRGFQYKVGETYEENVRAVCCESGFHFCVRLLDCFNYYSFDPRNRVAEVEALGVIDSDGTKSCTNKIRIVRELTWYEVLDLVNLGKHCDGLGNVGDHNNGSFNSGDCNKGRFNSGCCNKGSYNSSSGNHGNGNSGGYNFGSYNSGCNNAGDHNSGDWNVGHCNSGDWNKTSYSNGCFNTEPQKIYLFNKPSDWTYDDWRNSYAARVMNAIPNDFLLWISSENMTYEEKMEHPKHEITGGFLKRIECKSKRQTWWNELSDEKKETILNIPNFDKKIFKEITGIDIEL